MTWHTKGWAHKTRSHPKAAHHPHAKAHKTHAPHVATHTNKRGHPHKQNIHVRRSSLPDQPARSRAGWRGKGRYITAR